MFLCFLEKIELSLTQHLGKQVASIERQNTCKLARKIPCAGNHFQKQQVQIQIHLTQSYNKHKLMLKNVNTCLS